MWIAVIVGLMIGVYWIHSDQKAAAYRAEEQSKDRENCAALLVKASASDPTAMYEYGELVLTGKGTTQDDQIGVQWIQAAAAQNEPRALLKLGVMYGDGTHKVKYDDRLAIKYLERAQQLGQPDAASELSRVRRKLWIANKFAHEFNEDTPADTAAEKLPKENAVEMPAIAKAAEPDWTIFHPYLNKCGSNPEKVLLKALITAANLKPDGIALRGKVEVIPQANVLKFRIDFLVNGHLAVEVDGKSYHGDDASFERDRLRDQELILNGYLPIRFPAAQIVRAKVSCANKVIRAAKRRKMLTSK